MIPIPPTVTLRGIWAAVCAALFLIVLVFGVIQTARLEGFKVWPFKVEGALGKVDRLEGEIQAIVDGQKEAARAQQAVNDAAEAAYEDIADRIDNEQAEISGAALAGVDRYIAAQRVRCPALGGTPGGASAPSGHTSPGDGQTVPAAAAMDGAVAVPESAIRNCTLNTLQANAARDWALQLEAESHDGGREP